MMPIRNILYVLVDDTEAEFTGDKHIHVQTLSFIY